MSFRNNLDAQTARADALQAQVDELLHVENPLKSNCQHSNKSTPEKTPPWVFFSPIISIVLIGLAVRGCVYMVQCENAKIAAHAAAHTELCRSLQPSRCAAPAQGIERHLALGEASENMLYGCYCLQEDQTVFQYTLEAPMLRK